MKVHLLVNFVRSVKRGLTSAAPIKQTMEKLNCEQSSSLVSIFGQILDYKCKIDRKLKRIVIRSAKTGILVTQFSDTQTSKFVLKITFPITRKTRTSVLESKTWRQKTMQNVSLQ